MYQYTRDLKAMVKTGVRVGEMQTSRHARVGVAFTTGVRQESCSVSIMQRHLRLLIY